MTYLSGIIDVIGDKESPKGCMFVKSACESGGVRVMTIAALKRPFGKSEHFPLPANCDFKMQCFEVF